jgi:hypothetical protein
VNLPEVGSLAVQRVAAQLKGRRRLAPPRSRVVFSRVALPGAPSIVDLLADHDAEKAGEIYAAWLGEHGVRKGEQLPHRIEIEGVGHITGKVLHPGEQLGKLLDPLDTGPVKLKPRMRAGWVVAVVAVVLVGAGAWFVVTLPSLEERRQAYWDKMARGVKQREMEGLIGREQKSDPGTLLPDSIAEKIRQRAKEDSLRADSVAVASAAPDDSPTVVADKVAGPLYHVVFGLYSTRENADTFIRRFKARNPSSTIVFTLVPYPDGKLIISGYSSSSRAEASARRRELADKYPDIWVYTQR